MNAVFLDSFWDMIEWIGRGYAVQNRLQPVVSQLQEFYSQFRLAKYLHASYDSDRLQTLVELQLLYELLQQLLEHEIERAIHLLKSYFT